MRKTSSFFSCRFFFCRLRLYIKRKKM